MKGNRRLFSLAKSHCMKRFFVISSLAISLVFVAAPAVAAPSQQWASNIIGFSSQYGTTDWSANQATGAPNTFSYGDIATAWASANKNGTLEYIILGYATPVYATGAVIRETCGNGFVYQVDVLDESDVLHTVWTGADPSQPGTPVDFKVTWPMTTYLVKGLKIYVNTDATTTWEEIDAVQLLSGQSAFVPMDLLLADAGQWAGNVIAFSSQWGTSGWAAQQATGIPNTFVYGDLSTAWAPANKNGTLEYITLGYATSVYASGAVIRETCGNGFVYQVDALDVNDVFHTVWTGSDPSQPGTPVDFKVTWPTTGYLVKGLKIYVNTDATTTWEETDAVQLLSGP